MATEDAPGPSLPRRLAQVWADAARAGRPMPGEPALAAALSSSRPAVREALVRLEEQGYIHRRQGADTAVNAALLDVPARFDRRLDQSDLITAMGREPTVDVLAAGVDDIRWAEAQEFDLPPSTQVYRVTKLWRADGVPVLLARDAVPLERGRDAADLDPARPLVDLSAALTGRTVEWELVWPGAESLTAEDAAAVDRPVGEAALCVDASGGARTGATCYWTRELHLRGAFRYAMVRRADWH